MYAVYFNPSRHTCLQILEVFVKALPLVYIENKACRKTTIVQSTAECYVCMIYIYIYIYIYISDHIIFVHLSLSS